MNGVCTEFANPTAGQPCAWHEQLHLSLKPSQTCLSPSNARVSAVQENSTSFKLAQGFDSQTHADLALEIRAAVPSLLLHLPASDHFPQSKSHKKFSASLFQSLQFKGQQVKPPH